MRFLRFITMLAVFLATGFAAQAQDSVAARTGSHKGYARLVFEWPAKPEYSLSKEGGRVLIRFARAGTVDASGVNASDANIKKIETLSSGTEPLQVAVTIPEGSRFRDFIVANKLILDVYDPSGAAKTAETPAAVVEEKTPEPKVEAKAEAPKVEEAKVAEKPEEKTKGDFSIQPAESAKTAPVVDVEAKEVPAPAVPPHAITLTTTTSTGMAVYRRNGVLWIVLDNTDLQGAPQITGPKKEQFPPMEKIDLPDATLYRLELPDGMNAYGDGGGLNWRIDLTQAARGVKSAVPTSEEGKLVWPLREMRKVISFTDPMVGDTVTVVTAPDATQLAGAPRNYVNLQTLPSMVGLAFVAKSDDLKTEKTLDHVSVTRPEGLQLSNAKDITPEQIRKAAAPEETPAEAKPEEAAPVEEKPAEEHAQAKPEGEQAEENKDPQVAAEEKAAHALPEEVHADVPPAQATQQEIAKAGEEKPSGNNIYNFPRWAMGGISALDSNMHVMMMEVSNKKEDARTEDLITMAKLNIANDRGAEAMGLLRMALIRVPELEDNAEFNALRGASLALSHKYDESIIDFTRESVKKYDDIKYWTAYALAGLEDWKQAIAIMPKDFAPIAAYPADIKIPLILTFAEVALRGADVPMANRLLDMLKPDLPKLALPYASYWNYLAGEAARQGGDPDKAIEYWEPLVKNGKDDLFRAKAGLSLTKLLLDQKKIKPTEAVNTLEGLRYAWRGDELETLINLRLGQMYIDNKDYLKGLTVLRNAATMSPGTEINKDVNDYMVRTFREVFNNDRIKSISPLEAISLHEEFKDLLPPGEEGDRFVEKLAERLVEADLLGRAAALLEYQVNNRLKGDKKAEIAIRLAAIRLLDGNPDGALRSLEIAQDTLDKIAGVKPAAEVKPEDVKPEAGEATEAKPEEKTAAATPPVPAKETVDPEKQRQVYLLKARALSMKKETDKAMAILEDMRLDADVNRLRVDIAWGAGRWEEAALALNDLITSEDISGKRPLTDYQRDIILNRAIALNLSGNRVALANLRERYNAQMKDTTKGQMFEVVTRPRRADMIGSRQAIDSMISEIDLFKGFLDGYAKIDAKPEAKAPAAPKEAIPVEAKPAAAGATPEAKKSVTELPETQPETKTTTSP